MADDGGTTYELGENRYGKSRIRLVTVRRGPDRHDLRDMTVAVALEGEFDAVHTHGDNANVIATDTMKNTVYAFARDRLTGSPEEFGLELARHFAAYEVCERATIDIVEHPWTRVPTRGGEAPDAFVRSGQHARLASVIVDRSGGAQVIAGIDDLTVMKTTKSAFTGFDRDRYTTLPEVDDRLMATKVRATWGYRSDLAAAADFDFDGVWKRTTEALMESLAAHFSKSVQESIWIMGTAMMDAEPSIEWVRMVLPNLHHWKVDLAPFGLDNPAEVFVSTTEPHGLIDATVRRRPAGDPAPTHAAVSQLPHGVAVNGPRVEGSEAILTPDALAFVAHLQRSFNPVRVALLERRVERQAEIDAGATLGLLPETAAIRLDRTWRVAEAPPDLLDRRVEITGPAEPKMIINALNSGARAFMADFEDSLSPTWSNIVGGQVAVRDAVRGSLAFESPEGKSYRLGDRVAQLLVRPRGWHLEERHVVVDGEPVSASLFDAGMYLYWNGRERVSLGTGPYFYLPKLQSHREARLWNDVFVQAQAVLGIPRGSVRATVLIETIHAAFEMEEILYELREHSSGLNAGRWDYLFSAIKTFRGPSAPVRDVLPDRAQVTMNVPFMRAYTERLVLTCHRRGAHAMGGMAAFIPSRRDAAVNSVAMARVREDKERESRHGFDGTWVAHPDLVPLATEVFDGVLGSAPDQRAARVGEAPLGAEVPGDPADLLDLRIPGGAVTEAGVRLNISVALQYLDAWLGGNGAAAINNLMEDAATAEISRSQLWQWRVSGTRLDDGAPLTADRYRAIRAEELAALVRDAATNPVAANPAAASPATRLDEAAELLDALVLDDDFTEFLTLPAYDRLR